MNFLSKSLFYAGLAYCISSSPLWAPHLEEEAEDASSVVRSAPNLQSAAPRVAPAAEDPTLHLRTALVVPREGSVIVSRPRNTRNRNTRLRQWDILNRHFTRFDYPLGGDPLLSISSNQYREFSNSNGTLCLNSSLPNLTASTCLDVSSNCIDFTDVMAIAQDLHSLPGLRSLNLAYNFSDLTHSSSRIGTDFERRAADKETAALMARKEMASWLSIRFLWEDFSAQCNDLDAPLKNAVSDMIKMKLTMGGNIASFGQSDAHSGVKIEPVD